jgi:hypothetical protein
MYIIKTAWIYIYVSAQEKLMKTQVVMDHLKIQVQVICCWHMVHRCLLGSLYILHSYDRNELYVTE